DGVVYVPALLGLGSPRWDYGARGTLLGITRGTSRSHIVRAVLEGVAQRGADLVEAAEADTGCTLERLRLDGGMSTNPTFVQAVADATQRPVEVSPEREATTLGAGFLTGLAIGTWQSWADIADAWAPSSVVEPARQLDRDRWRCAANRAAGWEPELRSIPCWPSRLVASAHGQEATQHGEWQRTTRRGPPTAAGTAGPAVAPRFRERPPRQTPPRAARCCRG